MLIIYPVLLGVSYVGDKQLNIIQRDYNFIVHSALAGASLVSQSLSAAAAPPPPTSCRQAPPPFLVSPQQNPPPTCSPPHSANMRPNLRLLMPPTWGLACGP